MAVQVLTLGCRNFALGSLRGEASTLPLYYRRGVAFTRNQRRMHSGTGRMCNLRLREQGRIACTTVSGSTDDATDYRTPYTPGNPSIPLGLIGTCVQVRNKEQCWLLICKPTSSNRYPPPAKRQKCDGTASPARDLLTSPKLLAVGMSCQGNGISFISPSLSYSVASILGPGSRNCDFGRSAHAKSHQLG